MIKRLKMRKSLNRYDKFDNKFYLNVQKGFLKLAKKDKKKYQIIDSNLDIKLNELQIIQTIKRLV
jgi:dTMP kinase